MKEGKAGTGTHYFPTKLRLWMGILLLKMKMYFDIQTDYVNAVEKIYGKKRAANDSPENSPKKEYVVTPEGWILPKSLMGRDDG